MTGNKVMKRNIFFVFNLLILNFNTKCVGDRVYRQTSDGNCAPPNIPNGKFSIRGQNYSPGSPIPNNAIVVFQCHRNFQLSPLLERNVCYDGMWDKEIPECLRVCPPVTSKSVDLTCELNGQVKNCSHSMVENTIMYMSCKHYFTQYEELAPSTTAVCRNGFWDQPLISCVPECGQRVISPTYVVNGVSAKQGEFPWHVGIYRKTNNAPKQVYYCGGSIISVKVVLTVAHCFTDDIDGRLFDISEYSVLAGKYYSDYDSPIDTLVQKRKITKVEIPRGYKSSLSNFARDIAVVIISEAFEISKVVQPICVDWNMSFENEQLRPNSNGHLVGWGYTNPQIEKPSVELKYVSLPYIHHDTCIDTVPQLFIKFITTDKFCAGYTNGSSACNGDSGGGIVFERKEIRKTKYYIRGLVSVGPVKDGICDNNYYGVYTKVSMYMNFIKRVEALNRDPFITPNRISTESISCSLPELTNGKISEIGAIPRSKIPNLNIISLECNKNYILFPSNRNLTCIDGDWDKKLPECRSACPPLVSSTSVKITCKVDGIEQNCTEPLVNATVATMRCNPCFTHMSPNSITEMMCIDKIWQYPIIQCIPGICAKYGDPYYGRLIGRFKEFAHGIEGMVYAVNENTIFIKGFSYDGYGPDPFFWIGDSPKPNPSGYVIPYPEGNLQRTPLALEAYNNADIILRLPLGKRIKDIRWISVWSRRYTVTFGEVYIPSNLKVPKPHVLPAFKQLTERLHSGNITILDTRSFYISNLTFRGTGPDANFWVGYGSEPIAFGNKVPNEMGNLDPLRGYQNENIEIQLPGMLTVLDFDWLAVWSVQDSYNFGHVMIPHDLEVPPAIGKI